VVQYTQLTILSDEFAARVVELHMSNHAPPPTQVEIYVTAHCESSHYALEVAAMIGREFPEVDVRVIEIGMANVPIPESVFATPTYLLNGTRWLLGNPSPHQVRQALGRV
jgi:hypothetical protein